MTEIIGWIGVAAYVVAYALLSIGWMRADRVSYHALNAVGGVCLVVIAYAKSDDPNLIVNLAWILIAAVSIVRIVRQARQ